MPQIATGDVAKYAAACKSTGALVEPTPRPQHQRGPSCGIYALSVVLEHWYERLTLAGHKPAARPLPARKHTRPLTDEEKAAEAKKSGPGSLREIAKETGITAIGELWRAAEMVAIAQTAGYKGKVARTGTGKAETANLTALLCHLLEQGFPCIVGFDVNATNNYGVHEHSGDPGKSKGDHAHWAVVCGYLVSKAATYFVATHWNKYYCWPANALLESNGQLNRWEKGGDWEKERRVVTSGFLWLRSTTVERSEFSAPGTVKSPVKTNHLPNTDLDMRDLTVVIYPNDPSVVAPTL